MKLISQVAWKILKFVVLGLFAFILTCFFIYEAGAQTPHGVAFTWTQSTTPGITANALKCGTATKVYPLVWTFNSPTALYDWLTNDPVNLPIQGQIYFCVVTAKKGSIESDPSPELTFPFPTVPIPPAGLQRTEH